MHLLPIVLVLLLTCEAQCYHLKGCGSDERESLTLFNKALKGKGWNHLWPINDPKRHHCDWYGVTCNQNKRVTKIDLQLNNLKGRLPRSTYCFPHLQTLYLQNNYISGTIYDKPDAGISKLKSLKYLDLRNNMITGNIPTGMCKLKASLMYLNIQHNVFSGSIPDCFDVRFQKSLRGFAAHCNKLSGRIPEGFKDMKFLESLHIHCQHLGFHPSQCPTFKLPDSVDVKCGKVGCKDICRR
ncbi:hypothetical protein P9112_014154 [Eukaryota sp. TZLM1-RC]